MSIIYDRKVVQMSMKTVVLVKYLKNNLKIIFFSKKILLPLLDRIFQSAL